MSTPSNEQKELYKRLSPILGIESKVVGYGDDKNNLSIDILTCPDPIDKNVYFYSTLGLFNNVINNNRYEILMTGYNRYEYVSNVLSSCAFFVIKNGWECKIGSIFETILDMYYPNFEMKHIVFVAPYIWEEKLEDFELGNNKINFVLGIPISQKELEYKNKNGLDALETLLEEHDTDIFDIERSSLI